VKHQKARGGHAHGAEKERAGVGYPLLLGSRRRRPIITGIRRSLRVDFYVTLLETSWPALLGGLAVFYLLINGLFASLYLLDPHGLTNVRPGSFADVFFFSVQTFTTLGYGQVAPVSMYANMVVVVEAFSGVLNIALATGLVFARVSRPRARVLFSGPAVITMHEGTPTLMFRVANARGNQIMEAGISVSLARQHVSREGYVMRRFDELKLIRNSTPLFALSWTVMHPIGTDSPLHGATRTSLIAQEAEIIVLLSGTDETYAEKIYARHSYIPHDIHWDRRFVDILSLGPDGRRILDLGRFHDTDDPDVQVAAVDS
jgi:inward rectifier potassium channel